MQPPVPVKSRSHDKGRTHVSLEEFRMSNASTANDANVDRAAANLSLASLVARIAKGDQDAVGALFDLTSSTVNAVAIRMLRNREDAEEIVLEVYIKVWRTADRFDASRGSPIAWLIAMTRSAAMDRLRSRVRTATETFDERPDLQASAATQDLWPGERIGLQRAIAAIPAEQRKALELAFFEGLTHLEVAEQLSLPLGTVKTRIRLGLARVRKSMEGGVQ
jgi:RNA polymerase sigma-70 factor (ECF subfamily)